MSWSSTSLPRGSPSSPSIWSCASSSIFFYSPHAERENYTRYTEAEIYTHTYTLDGLAWAEKIKEEASCPRDAMDHTSLNNALWRITIFPVYNIQYSLVWTTKIV